MLIVTRPPDKQKVTEVLLLASSQIEAWAEINYRNPLLVTAQQLKNKVHNQLAGCFSTAGHCKGSCIPFGW